MDMTIFIPRTFHRSLAFIGKRDWCGIAARSINNGVTGATIGIEHLPSVEDAAKAGVDANDYKKTVAFIYKIAPMDNQSSLLYVYALSKSLATGPKVFMPNAEQCRALANVTIDLSVTDYYQPYPVMLYVFPKEYLDELSVEFKQPKRVAAAISHKFDDSGLLVGSQFVDNTQIMGLFISRDQHIEESLKKKVMTKQSGSYSFKTREEMLAAGFEDDDLSDFDMTERIERLCMNLGLVLAGYPVTLEPLNPREFAKATANKNSKSAARRELGEKFLVSEMQKIKLKQDIKFHEDKYVLKNGAVVSTPIGRMMPSHWRKGHMRRLRIERGWKQDKNIFIKAVRIHKEWDPDGDTTGTEVTYKG